MIPQTVLSVTRPRCMQVQVDGWSVHSVDYRCLPVTHLPVKPSCSSLPSSWPFSRWHTDWRVPEWTVLLFTNTYCSGLSSPGITKLSGCWRSSRWKSHRWPVETSTLTRLHLSPRLPWPWPCLPHSSLVFIRLRGFNAVDKFVFTESNYSPRGSFDAERQINVSFTTVCRTHACT